MNQISKGKKFKNRTASTKKKIIHSKRKPKLINFQYVYTIIGVVIALLLLLILWSLQKKRSNEKIFFKKIFISGPKLNNIKEAEKDEFNHSKIQ